VNIEQVDLKKLTMAQLAAIVRANWFKISDGGRMYLSAMGQLGDIAEAYYADPGTEVVARFLCNATTWTGPVARQVKKELNRRLNVVRKAVSKGVNSGR